LSLQAESTTGPNLVVSPGRGKTARIEEVMTMFRNRVDAGRHLAQVVQAAGLGGDRTVVLGLPRGGVPVAAEVGSVLGAPLDVLVVRKLGVPFQPELAMGAIGEDGIRVENEDALGSSAVSAVDFEAIERRERRELNRRASRYREGRPRLDLEGRCVVIVDDGIATGATARAACHVARAHGASRIVLAVPVAPAATVSAFQDVCDDMLCVANPDPFFAVGEWYHDFSPTSDEEVNELLSRAQL
jgi:putative phosphoribosyl transferase